MRILMLGWEFPPFITGGLGTACYGLTQAMERLKTDILFLLPISTDSYASPSARKDAAGDPGSASADTAKARRLLLQRVPSEVPDPYYGAVAQQVGYAHMYLVAAIVMLVAVGIGRLFRN